MRRALLLITAAIGLSATAGQLKVKPLHLPQQASAEGLEWLSRSTPDELPATIIGLGTGGNPALEAGAYFPATELTGHVGKQVLGVAICAAAPSNTVTVFVKTGEMNSSTYAKRQILNEVAVGWNYYMFPSPYEIKEGEGLVVGYSMKENFNFPAAFDGRTVVSPENQYMKIDLSEGQLEPAYGNVMVGMLVGGDPNVLANRLTFKSIEGPEYANRGEQVDLTAQLINPSVNEVSSMTLQLTVNGRTETIQHEFNRAIRKNDDGAFDYTIPVLLETTKLRFEIVAVNGQPLATPQVMEKTVTCVVSDDEVPRKVLVEKFTGQYCQFCADGETAVKNATTNLRDRVVRISHHSGYYPDMFTIGESLEIASYYGVVEAPQVMVDRTYHPSLGQNFELVWHPSFISEELLMEELAVPTYVTIDVESSIDTDRKVTVKATGHANADIANPMIHLLLTQDGYDSFQIYPLNTYQEHYTHNHFPVAYLTGMAGKALTINANGDYSYEGTLTLPETLTNDEGTFEVRTDKLVAVGFITQDTGKETARVHNANWAALGKSSATDPHVPNYDTGALDTLTEPADIDIRIEGGRIVCSAEGATVEAYDALGRRLEEGNLPTGSLIVVKVTTPQGDTLCTKLIN